MYEHNLEHAYDCERIKVLDRTNSDLALKTLINYIYNTQENHGKTKINSHKVSDKHFQVLKIKRILND